MKSEDPIDELQRYYVRLNQDAVPALPPVTQRIKWWEAAGGLAAAGIAAVAVAVNVCISSVEAEPRGGGTMLERQMRSAGLLEDPVQPRKRAQSEAEWAI